MSRRSSFTAIAGVAGVLAAGLIRDSLQPHLLPLAWASSQPPRRRPRSPSGRAAALSRAGRDSRIRAAERKTAHRRDPPSRWRGTSSLVAEVGECLQAARSRLGPQALAGLPGRRRRCAQLQSATWPPRRAFAQIHACSASTGTTAFALAARRPRGRVAFGEPSTGREASYRRAIGS